MKKRKVVFVINLKSGSDRKTDRERLIRGLLSDAYESDVLIWEKLEDRERLFSRATSGDYDIAVAVGGDGTVSQLADALSGTTTALGIIPFGSGNGLARHLGIPLESSAAMKLIETGIITKIDRGQMNERAFFCTCGVGFDAHIGKLFAESTSRGFWTYAKMTLRELRKYKEKKYKIEIDGNQLETKAFLIAIGNGGQYGNNAWIAPTAKINDGVLQISILKPFRWWNAFRITRKLFAKKFHTSKFVESYSGKSIRITRETEDAIHYDGEPDFMGKEILIQIEPSTLHILVPENFKG